jgi:hypothetical protein
MHDGSLWFMFALCELNSFVQISCLSQPYWNNNMCKFCLLSSTTISPSSLSYVGSFVTLCIPVTFQIFQLCTTCINAVCYMETFKLFSSLTIWVSGCLIFNSYFAYVICFFFRNLSHLDNQHHI